MDDVFHDEPGTEVASLTLDQLHDIQRQIKGPDKKMNMYVTFYGHGLNLPIAEYLKLISVSTLWIWKPEELADLDSHMAKLDKLAPHSRKMLGLLYGGFTKRKLRHGGRCFRESLPAEGAYGHNVRSLK